MEYKTILHLGAGHSNLKDILEELKKPGKDPRELPQPVLRTDVMDINDLKLEMTLRNRPQCGGLWGF